MLVFFVLNVLVLRGSELALDLLIFLSGMVVGFIAARLATYPFRKIGGPGIERTVGLFVGLALVFVIIFGGTALAGIPPYPTAEGGNVGNMIYGLALGFLVGLPGGLVSDEAGSHLPLPGSNLKVVAVILGTVAALFGLLFVLFLLLEYALVPLIRAFAG
ncbi:hypothetical protein GBA63_03750 [Rubrobacter tropicus]|uniref:Uncharacterized protein n=1 Tax=Rubrobacter tropicus TaxID=2653851 RepID=A0A6G8Q5V0_9ACTN|nr:hypothetical protein [Rubrobacter tropicus]QIN81851.1 hypothetical protein GBA63_03750 [Rubrobacter tropicus]